MKWDTTKPIDPGAYWVRGYEIGNELKQALVEISTDSEGCLRCNLGKDNADTFDDKPDGWAPLSRLSSSFEWCGPLMPYNGH